MIDHIYTNSINNFRSSGVITDPIADHLGTFLKIGIGSKLICPKGPTHYNHTDYSDDNVDGFINLLNSADWAPVSSTDHPNDMYNSFDSIFLLITTQLSLPRERNVITEKKRVNPG